MRQSNENNRIDQQNLETEENSMSMSKKDFIALADFLKARTITPNNGGTFTPYQIEQLADFCQWQNSNFNRERFIAYINGECGPSGGKK